MIFYEVIKCTPFKVYQDENMYFKITDLRVGLLIHCINGAAMRLLERLGLHHRFSKLDRSVCIHKFKDNFLFFSDLHGLVLVWKLLEVS